MGCSLPQPSSRNGQSAGAPCGWLTGALFPALPAAGSLFPHTAQPGERNTRVPRERPLQKPSLVVTMFTQHNLPKQAESLPGPGSLLYTSLSQGENPATRSSQRWRLEGPCVAGAVCVRARWVAFLSGEAGEAWGSQRVSHARALPRSTPPRGPRTASYSPHQSPVLPAPAAWGN